MKKILFLLISLFLFCCNNNSNVEVNETKYIVNNHNVEIFVIDSCEYLIGGIGDSRWGTHKGNCKYCLKRNQIK